MNFLYYLFFPWDLSDKVIFGFCGPSYDRWIENLPLSVVGLLVGMVSLARIFILAIPCSFSRWTIRFEIRSMFHLITWNIPISNRETVLLKNQYWKYNVTQFLYTINTRFSFTHVLLYSPKIPSERNSARSFECGKVLCPYFLSLAWNRHSARLK